MLAYLVDLVSFVVETATIQFDRREELDFFGCENTTLLGQRVPLDSLNCTSSVISFLNEYSANTSSFLFSSGTTALIS